MNDRFVAGLRKDQAAASDERRASKHDGHERPVIQSATKHWLDSERQSSPPASKTCARKDTGAVSLSTIEYFGLRESTSNKNGDRFASTDSSFSSISQAMWRQRSP